MYFGWIFTLFFLAILSSQSLMDLSSTLVVLAMGVLAFRQHRRGEKFSMPNLGLEEVFAIWVFVVIIGFFLNLQDETPWLKNVLEYRWILEFYFYIKVFDILKPTEEDFKKILPIFLLASLYAVVVYFLKFDPIYQSWGDRLHQLENYRTGGLFSNPMPFAHTYGPIAILFFGPLFLLSWREWIKKPLWSLSVLLGLSAIILSFTRGVWIGIIIGLVAMGFVVNMRKGLKAAASVLVVVLVLMATVDSVRERVLFSLTPGKTYDSERLIIWKANWLIFLDYPLVGIGYSENGRRLGEYFERMNVPEGYLQSHAHNQYLHFLAGTGILGLTCFLLIIFGLFRLHLIAYRNFKKIGDEFYAGLSLGVIGAETCFYIAGTTESNFSIAKNRYTLLMIWALGCWLWKFSKTKIVGAAIPNSAQN